MKELIKKIREYTGLSQTEFSYRIGVSFATINRWENGHSFPTPLAQEKLYELCQDYNVPAYEMIVTGEKTGQLAEMMYKVSTYYQSLHKKHQVFLPILWRHHL